MRLVRLLAVLTALVVLGGVVSRADAVPQQLDPERNFLTFLLPASGGLESGFGFLLFRQPPDGQKIVFLDVLLLNLARNHGYYLQRATDTTVDDNCTGTNWLTLGQGLEPQVITTGRKGFAEAHLFRDLSAVRTGARFDIQFRVVDASNPDVAVLVSPCQQFRVSP